MGFNELLFMARNVLISTQDAGCDLVRFSKGT